MTDKPTNEQIEAFLGNPNNTLFLGTVFGVSVCDLLRELVSLRRMRSKAVDYLCKEASCDASPSAKDTVLEVALDLRARMDSVRILYDRCDPKDPLRILVDTYEQVAAQLEEAAEEMS